MIEFIKHYDYNTIRKKFIAIYLFNITDIMFTLFLINTNLFREANVLMRYFIDSSKIASILMKSGLTLILLIIMLIRMRKASEKQLYYSNIIINLCLIFYGMLNISHIFWSVMYLSL
jgi:hypothetical protein